MKATANISDLPFSILQTLTAYLNVENEWEKLFHVSELSKQQESFYAYKKLTNPAEALLHDLSVRGRTAKDLLILLDKAKIENAQLVLRRKYKPVEIVEQSPLNNTFDRGSTISLFCKADAFPYAKYQWFHDGRIIDFANSSVLELGSEDVQMQSVFHCTVWNLVPENQEWSDFYCKNDKRHKSDVNSNFMTVVVVPSLKDASKACSTCDNCAAVQRVMEKIRDVIDDEEIAPPCSCQKAGGVGGSVDQTADDEEEYLATDKIALIVSNSEYWHLPKLLTPACDAQALAEALLTCGFKTVTLADLTRYEMRIIIDEYCRMLGAGVYALFYFVGHGFEINGQCYLLPVDAPNEDYTCDDCFSAEEVLSMIQETDPSLNVILLDVCRKFPTNTVKFQRNKLVKPKVNRNTVFGYATTSGEGAYEIRGETNGIFMKYLKRYIDLRKPVVEVLHMVMRDLENDPKGAEVQFPEIKTNLSRPRSLADPMNPSGHTKTFDHRTLRWQEIHELPDPVKVRFNDYNFVVTIWFDFCGHFTNMVYAFTSVSTCCGGGENGLETIQDDVAMQYLAYLKFPDGIETLEPMVCDDTEEGVSVSMLIKHLQRFKGDLTCTVDLNERINAKTVARTNVVLGKILIGKLDQWHEEKIIVDDEREKS